MTKAIFCEVDAIDIDRYFSSLLPDLNPVGIVLESAGEVVKYRQTGRFKTVPILSMADNSVAQMEKFFIDCRCDTVVINGNRITDLLITLIAKSIAIDVVYIQHGMYIEFMKRTSSFFVSQFLKTTRYFGYAVRVAMLLKSPSLLLNLIAVHIFGKPRSVLTQYPFYPDLCWVYTQYWQDWHIQKYGFPSQLAYSFFTFPDFIRFESRPERKDRVLYVYQTLVEDGRISPAIMDEFYFNLLRQGTRMGVSVIVKGHPRMSSIYRTYFGQANIEVVEEYVPLTDIVIGHYSTLLGFCGTKGSKVVCIPLEGHIIPESFAWANQVGRVEDLQLRLMVSNVEGASEIFGSIDSKLVAPQCFIDGEI